MSKQESNRKYREANKQRISDYHSNYREEHKVKLTAQQAAWAKANPEQRRRNARNYYYKLRDAAMEAYGGLVCNWCGIDEPLVLGIDHIDGGGNAHRKELSGKTTNTNVFFRWLRDNDYPPGFQVLCMNCNHAKSRNGNAPLESLRGRCNDHPRRGSRGKRPEAHGIPITVVMEMGL